MKLPQIQYRGVSRISGAPGPQAAVAEYRANQSTLQAAMDVGGEIAKRKVENDVAAASTALSNYASNAKIELAEKDTITREEILSAGVDPANPNIDWTDNNGEEIQVFKTHEVEAAMMAQLLEDRIQEYGGNIGLPSARQDFIRQAQEAATSEVTRIALSSIERGKVYDAREAEATKDALIAAGDFQGLFTFLDANPYLSTRPDVRQGYLEEAREGYMAKVAPELEAITDDGVRAAREGNTEGAAAAVSTYSLVLDDFVAKGVIADPSTATHMKEQYAKRLSVEEMRTRFRQSLDDPMQRANVAETLSRFRDEDMVDWTVAEQEEVFKLMVSDLNTHSSLMNEREDSEDKARVDSQRQNEGDLLLGILRGDKDGGDILTALETGAIRPEKAATFSSAFETRGQGVTDWSVSADIQEDIRNIEDEEDLQGVLESIADQTGANLSSKRAEELAAEAYKRLDQESAINTSRGKRANDYIIKSIRISGPMGALDPKAERKLAEAEREWSDLVLGGMDPFAAADKVVGDEDYRRAERSMVSLRDQFPGIPAEPDTAIEWLKQQYGADIITADDYDYAVGAIEQFQRAKQLVDDLKQELDDGR